MGDTSSSTLAIEVTRPIIPRAVDSQTLGRIGPTMFQPSGGTGSAFLRFATGAALLLLAWSADAPGQDSPRSRATPAPEVEGVHSAPDLADVSLLATIEESLCGDVYAEGRWRPLTLRTFFTEGWLEPWAAPPAGRDGLTPRHGWLGAFNGVFYRFWTAEFGYTNAINCPLPRQPLHRGIRDLPPLLEAVRTPDRRAIPRRQWDRRPRRGYLTQTVT